MSYIPALSALAYIALTSFASSALANNHCPRPPGVPPGARYSCPTHTQTYQPGEPIIRHPGGSQGRGAGAGQTAQADQRTSVHCQLEADGKCHCGPRRGTGRQIPCRPEPQRNTPAPGPTASARETSDCQTSNRPGTVLVLRTALDVAKCIFDLYETGFPILIGRAEGFSMRTCVMLLAGTEPSKWEQATTLPEDIGAALNDPYNDQYRQAILAALLDMKKRGICVQARLIMAGHSLGGMEAQNIALDSRAKGAGYAIGDIITFGAPATVELPRHVPRERFTTIGDTIPYSTLVTGTYRDVKQTIVSDLKGSARDRAIDIVDEERRIQTRPIVNLLWLLYGALGPHMQYPNVRELANYDAIGKPVGTGTVFRLRDVRRYSAVRY